VLLTGGQLIIDHQHILGRRARDKNDKVDSAIFAAVSDMRHDA
jgi:hypothetical protein